MVEKQISLRPGDQLLVQINREAMKGKLPALTANLNFSGKYLVLTTGNRKIGFSNKLSKEESSLLNKWLEPEGSLRTEAMLIARTNAAEASKEEFLHELFCLKKTYEKVAVNGRTVPASAFSMRRNLFMWQQSVMCTAEIWRKLLRTFRKFHEKLQKYLEDFIPDELEKLSFMRISFCLFISCTGWNMLWKRCSRKNMAEKRRFSCDPAD